MDRLVEFISPIDEREFYITNINVIEILARNKYRRALPSIIAATQLEGDIFDNNEVIRNAYANLIYFPSQRTTDLLIEAVKKYSTSRYGFGIGLGLGFAEHALETARQAGVLDGACPPVVHELEKFIEYYRYIEHAAVRRASRIMKEYGCPSIIFPDR
ncbi:MAG: hypothetical protein HY514_04140 [Candidatus Aenigmarchaeota archaeon]|nr:hypothetical protein [Candidatus Aenigmarchaeota archaeon]